MQNADKSAFRVGSASDILSGNLKDILSQKENKVIEVEIKCTVSDAAKKNV